MESSKGRALRRSHVKSKSGCLTCRHKHIRCDELRPDCRNCLKRGYKCDFSTWSTSTNANDNLPPHLSATAAAAAAAATDPIQIAATATSTGSKSGDGDNSLISTLWQEISALQLPNREFFPPRTYPPPSPPYDRHNTRSPQATQAPFRSPPFLSPDLSSSLQSQPHVSSHSSQPSHQPQSPPQHQPPPLQNRQSSSPSRSQQSQQAQLKHQQSCLNRIRISDPSLAEMPIEDFRMMHHAAQITEGLALSGGHRLALGTSSLPVFIDLARSHAFVKHALLGLATSHLNCLVKLTALEALGSRYRREACRGLQAELGEFSAENADAVLAASIMLSWQALDTPTYIKFMQGTSQVLKLMPPHSPTSRLSELFSPISPLSAHRHKQIMQEYQRHCGSSGTLPSSVFSQNVSKPASSSTLIDPPFTAAYAYNLASEVTENNHAASSTQIYTAMGSVTLPRTRTSLTIPPAITSKPAHTKISVPTTIPASTPKAALTSSSVPLTPTPPLISALSQNFNKRLEMTPLLTALRTLQSSLPPTTISQTELRATTLVLQNLLENFRMLCSSSSSMPTSKAAANSSKASKSTPSSASSPSIINLPVQFSLLYPVRTWLPLMPVSFLGVGRRDPWALVTMAYFHVAVVFIVGQLAEASLEGKVERLDKEGGAFRGEGCGGALFAGRRTEIVVRIDREIEALKLEAEREVEMEVEAEKDAEVSGKAGESVDEVVEKERKEGNDENETMDADGNMITNKIMKEDEIGDAESMIEATKIDSKEKLKELTRIEELMRVPLMYVIEYRLRHFK